MILRAVLVTTIAAPLFVTPDEHVRNTALLEQPESLPAGRAALPEPIPPSFDLEHSFDASLLALLTDAAELPPGEIVLEVPAPSPDRHGEAHVGLQSKPQWLTAPAAAVPRLALVTTIEKPVVRQVEVVQHQLLFQSPTRPPIEIPPPVQIDRNLTHDFRESLARELTSALGLPAGRDTQLDPIDSLDRIAGHQVGTRGTERSTLLEVSTPEQPGPQSDQVEPIPEAFHDVWPRSRALIDTAETTPFAQADWPSPITALRLPESDFAGSPQLTTLAVAATTMPVGVASFPETERPPMLLQGQPILQQLVDEAPPLNTPPLDMPIGLEERLEAHFSHVTRYDVDWPRHLHDWPNPVQRHYEYGHEAIGTAQLLVSVAVSETPFAETDWPNPTEATRLPFAAFERSQNLATLFEAEIATFVQHDWPLPSERPPAGQGFADQPAQLATLDPGKPAPQTDWPNPIEPLRVVDHEQFTLKPTEPIPFVGAVEPIIAPVPDEIVAQELGAQLELLTATFATPVAQYDWPVPILKTSLPDLETGAPSAQSTTLFVAVTTPGEQTDWPVPTRKTDLPDLETGAPSAQSTTLYVAPMTPTAFYDWPVVTPIPEPELAGLQHVIPRPGTLLPVAVFRAIRARSDSRVLLAARDSRVLQAMMGTIIYRGVPLATDYVFLDPLYDDGAYRKHADSDIVLDFDWFPRVVNRWRPGIEVATGQIVRPREPDGYAYQADGDGQTGKREPRWKASTTDGSVTWTRIAAGSNGIDVVSAPVVSVDPTGGLTLSDETVVEETKVRISISGGSSSGGESVTMPNGDIVTGYVVSIEVTTSAGETLKGSAVIVVLPR